MESFDLSKSADSSPHSVRRHKNIVSMNPPPDPETLRRYAAIADNHTMSSFNLYQDIEMTGKFVNTHEDISYEKDIVQLHSHSFTELLCCRSGEIQYLIGVDRYQIRPGDIICVPPNVSHRPLIPDHMELPYMRTVIWISPEFTGWIREQWPGLEISRGKGCVIHTTGTEWADLPDRFHQGYMESQRSAEGWEAWIYGNTLQILVEMSRAVNAQGSQPAEPLHGELLDDLIIYIENHLSEKITIEETARQMYVSPSAVRQAFTKNMDISFYRFVTLRRMIAAKTLIMEGIPLTDVARQVGYTDYTTFYRAFKQEYGISPSEYRELPLTGEQ